MINKALEIKKNCIMKTKEIKEMTKEERKAFVLMKFNYYKSQFIWDVLEEEKYEMNLKYDKEYLKIYFNLLKNMYYMENGEELNICMVLRL